jgi:hypothetical protein
MAENKRSRSVTIQDSNTNRQKRQKPSSTPKTSEPVVKVIK